MNRLAYQHNDGEKRQLAIDFMFEVSFYTSHIQTICLDFTGVNQYHVVGLWSDSLFGMS